MMLHVKFALLLLSSALLPLVSPECTHPIYCDGPILHAIQTSRVFRDSKTFVDLPTKASIAEIRSAFDSLPSPPSKDDITEFINTYFHPPGAEMKPVAPRDWVPSPSQFLENVKDDKLKLFGSAVHFKWKDLTRKFDTSQLCETCEVSSIVVKKPFIIPGGRFREGYYWDSYWILKGLFASKMYETAKDMLENFFEVIEKHGFYPNGQRIYYLNRSQPPLLALMVKDYLTYTQDISIIPRALNALIKEHTWWQTNRQIKITPPSSTDYVHLNIYNVITSRPRPESYIEDIETASHFSDEGDKAKLYSHLASGAESGWDFSSRWFNLTHFESPTNPPKLESTVTSNVVPVDLNSFMYACETVIAELLQHETVKNPLKAQYYQRLATERGKAIHSLLWDEEEKLWFDYDLREKKVRKEMGVYPSSYTPLWSSATTLLSESDIESVFTRLQSEIESAVHPGGVPTSGVQSGQQWDHDNVWPPLQHILSTFLHPSSPPISPFKFATLSTGSLSIPSHIMKRNLDTSLTLMQKYITTTYCGWYLSGGDKIIETGNPGLVFGERDTKGEEKGPNGNKNGWLFEKYDAKKVGKYGGGGEYIVQEGFGWTNGVILDFLENHGHKLTVPKECPRDVHNRVEFRL